MSADYINSIEISLKMYSFTTKFTGAGKEIGIGRAYLPLPKKIATEKNFSVWFKIVHMDLMNGIENPDRLCAGKVPVIIKGDLSWEIDTRNSKTGKFDPRGDLETIVPVIFSRSIRYGNVADGKMCEKATAIVKPLAERKADFNMFDQPMGEPISEEDIPF